MKWEQMPRPFRRTEHWAGPAMVEQLLDPAKPVEQKLIRWVPGFRTEQNPPWARIVEHVLALVPAWGSFSAEHACLRPSPNTEQASWPGAWAGPKVLQRAPPTGGFTWGCKTEQTACWAWVEQLASPPAAPSKAEQSASESHRAEQRWPC